jgi:VIT1/CCC1 family predicted Fe2+/Mn2+ transporter
MEVLTGSKSLLNPLDRAAEILFGLIMALTFTSSIGIASRGPAEIRELLVAAISCNVAWGLVDATMHLIGVLSQRSRSKTVFDFVKDSSRPEKAREHISNALPPIMGSAIGMEGLEQIRNKLISLPDSTTVDVRLTGRDFQKALAIFFLVFVSTFPVVMPFIFIRDANIALRVSNLIAILMMFLCGWSVAKYVGCSKWIMSIMMVLIGVFLVMMTIVLGG